jgi:hypothetical protein
MHGGDFKREVEKEANYWQYRKESFCSFRNYVSNGIAKAQRNEDRNPHLNEVKNLALHFCVSLGFLMLWSLILLLVKL